MKKALPFNILFVLECGIFQDFIESCLNQDPSKRPTARDLLFHTILLEVVVVFAFLCFLFNGLSKSKTHFGCGLASHLGQYGNSLSKHLTKI